MESVYKGDDLRPLQEIRVLELLRCGEQDLNRGPEAQYLQLAPKSTALTRHAVHDLTNVPKLEAEVLLEIYLLLVRRHRAVVHIIRALISNLNKSIHKYLNPVRHRCLQLYST